MESIFNRDLFMWCVFGTTSKEDIKLLIYGAEKMEKWFLDQQWLM